MRYVYVLFDSEYVTQQGIGGIQIYGTARRAIESLVGFGFVAVFRTEIIKRMCTIEIEGNVDIILSAFERDGVVDFYAKNDIGNNKISLFQLNVD